MASLGEAGPFRKAKRSVGRQKRVRLLSIKLCDTVASACY